jgi:transcriptional regulator with XRE-family HTH domain
MEWWGWGTSGQGVLRSDEVGERLYRLRLVRGLTQMQLAEAIGSSQRALSRYETVAEFPPAGVVIQLAKALHVSADELLGLRSSRRPRKNLEQRRL